MSIFRSRIDCKLVLFLLFSAYATMFVTEEYDERVAMKQKKMDMEYGEKLSSIELGPMKLSYMLRNETKMSQDANRDSANRPSTKCSTGLPIAQDYNEVDQAKINNKEVRESRMPASYIAPPKPKDQQHYYDDQ